MDDLAAVADLATTRQHDDVVVRGTLRNHADLHEVQANQLGREGLVRGE